MKRESRQTARTERIEKEIFAVQTTQELNTVFDACHLQYTHLENRLVRTFHIGDRVTFRTTRDEPVVGNVTKLNTRTVSLQTDMGRQWRVAPSGLTLIERKEDQSARLHVGELLREAGKLPT